jgi:hypothetical protein
MVMESAKRQAVFSWVTAGALRVLCGILAVLQYRWIGEVSLAQEDRLRYSLQPSPKRPSGPLPPQLGRISRRRALPV